MALTITAAERDALYDQILDRLSGIGDVWLSIHAENFEAADRLGREYCDDLRLVLDDLGWGDGHGGTIELTSPPDVLRRVFSRLRERAAGQCASAAAERVEIRKLEERHRLVTEACQHVLADLDGQTAGGDMRIA